MKKPVAIILAVFMCLCFFGCSKSESNDSFISDSVTENLPAPETTKQPVADSKKATALKQTMEEYLKNDNAEVKVNDKGGFEMKLKEIDEAELYSLEYNEDIEKVSFSNIDSYVNSFREYYPDGDSIEIFNTESKQISHGDNGIDSAVYIAIYINTQNQKLTVYADSTGELFYAECEFTW